ncbi:hypothetical protein GCM10009719_11640 [Nocardioides kribbensis]
MPLWPLRVPIRASRERMLRDDGASTWRWSATRSGRRGGVRVGWRGAPGRSTGVPGSTRGAGPDEDGDEAASAAAPAEESAGPGAPDPACGAVRSSVTWSV